MNTAWTAYLVLAGTSGLVIAFVLVMTLAGGDSDSPAAKPLAVVVAFCLLAAVAGGGLLLRGAGGGWRVALALALAAAPLLLAAALGASAYLRELSPERQEQQRQDLERFQREAEAERVAAEARWGKS